jgi:site-specific DNA recombinase
MKAVIYARVSTEEQAKDGRTSLTFQLEQCQDYCQRQGYEVLEQVIDGGFSGLSLDTPGLQKISELAQQGPFVLVAWSSDRLSRDVIRRHLIVNVMKEAGGRIEYATEKYEDSDTGEAIQDVLTTMHWLHARKNRENVWRGQYQKAKEGKLYPRYVRLGYDWSEYVEEGDRKGRKAPGAMFVVNEDEAKLARRIFDLYESMSSKKVAQTLNNEGFRLPCKSPKWRAKYGDRTERLFRDIDIMTIVKDELYTGTVTWGRTTKLTGKTPQVWTHHFPEWQIISFEQFNRTQRTIQSRRATPPKSVHSPYLFSGLLRCPNCGAGAVGRLDPNRSYAERQKRYDCNNYHRYGKAVCKGWTAYEQTIRKGVVAFLVDFFENTINIKEALANEVQAMAQEESGGQIGRAKETIEQGQRELRRIQELAVKGIMNDEEAAGFVREAREKIERAEKQLESIGKSAVVRSEISRALSLLDQDLAKAMNNMGDSILRQVCRQIFKSFTVEKSGQANRRTSVIDTCEFTPEIVDLLETLPHLRDITRRWDVPVLRKSSTTSAGSWPRRPSNSAWAREEWGAGNTDSRLWDSSRRRLNIQKRQLSRVGPRSHSTSRDQRTDEMPWVAR